MGEYNHVTMADGMQGAHNMPCILCGKVHWEQIDTTYPIWGCKTKDCKGILWSD